MRHRRADDSAVVPEAQQTIRRVDQLIRRFSVTTEYFFEHNPKVSCKKHLLKAFKDVEERFGVMIRARKGDTKRVSGGQRHRTYVCGFNKAHRGCLQRLRAKRAESMGREGKAQFSWPAAVEEYTCNWRLTVVQPTNDHEQWKLHVSEPLHTCPLAPRKTWRADLLVSSCQYANVYPATMAELKAHLGIEQCNRRVDGPAARRRGPSDGTLRKVLAKLHETKYVIHGCIAQCTPYFNV